MLNEKTRTEQADVDEFDVDAVNKAGQRQPLYAARTKIYPKRTSGTFRRFKWLMMLFTLGIYYATPWLRWDRGPFASDQLVLIDLENRRFFFAFIEIWPQEFYYVAGLLVMAGVGLFLVTSTVGRAWCGYACPQTVWVDLFLVVERAIEGDRNARIKLEAAPWGVGKLAKRVLKHASWIVIGVITGGAWIFYFADAPSLAQSFLSLQAPVVAYATVAVLTATTYVFGGLMREQVCIYMCPWPRIQAAMLDEYSLTVTYNDWRGEPRSKHAKKRASEGKPAGDCVDCNACVAVCPTGIDIRDGQQLECITCALCIDACDNVMDKLGKERGLISYATLDDYNANMAIATNTTSGNGVIKPANVRNPQTSKLVESLKPTNWRSIIRPRTILYLAVWCGIGLAMLTVLSLRSPLDINVLHDRNPLYVLLSDGSIRNGLDVKILNMTPKPRTIELSMNGLPGATMAMAGSSTQPTTSIIIDVEPDRVLPIRLYIHASPDHLNQERTGFTLIAENIDGTESASAQVNFEAPSPNP